ncbi:ribbon-helix-helix protein, CopG family [Streptomyces winkii]|uniref:ribbon-helix-helix protein, CopG family n=1 Tax=Streptomyces winkii TaxID=3051178 RepID=UPI0037DA4207
MTSKVLSLRLDSELFDRLHAHAAKRRMSVQDYVVRALVRDDFDERLQTSVEETERFYASAPTAGSSAAAGWSATGSRLPRSRGPR